MTSIPDKAAVHAGVIGGTLLSLLGSVTRDDLVRTVVLAAVGAVVSYGVTLVMRHLSRKER